MSKANNLWEYQQSWEDEISFKVFRHWLLMGEPRDIDLAWKVVMGREEPAPWHIVQEMNAQSYKMKQDGIETTWADRLRAMQIDQARYEIAWWEERKIEIRHKEFEVAQSLLSKAEEMLEWPIYREEMSEDGQIIIRTPTKWTLKDAATLVKVASDIQRLAAEMEQSRHLVQFTFSPEAMAAMEKLARYGVSQFDVVKECEQVILTIAEQFDGTEPTT